ncbi:MAG: hypothetical protein F4018_13005 [Acidobacteria bacterium]|nr:hypothetical protein [Chloroflexota bacterium]MYK89171.1 hypothetical protein [Acidobacteriota bacterium]
MADLDDVIEVLNKIGRELEGIRQSVEAQEMAYLESRDASKLDQDMRAFVTERLLDLRRARGI